MQSESINELAAALVAAQKEMGAVPKGSVNPFFKSKYAALPDVVASVMPVLAKHGLAISQFMSDDDTLTTYLLHQSGQFIAHRANLHLVKEDPQSAGSAVTYQRRYALMSCIGAVADEDDDGNRASQGTYSERPQAARDAGQAKYEQGSGNDDFDTILEASKSAPGNEFIQSLAIQIRARGSLTDKQLVAGVKSALKILTGPTDAEVAPEETF